LAVHQNFCNSTPSFSLGTFFTEVNVKNQTGGCIQDDGENVFFFQFKITNMKIQNNALIQDSIRTTTDQKMRTIHSGIVL
jgi:hypothetical protein